MLSLKQLQRAAVPMIALAVGACPPQHTSTTIEYAAVSAGGSHTCALAKTGTVYCWGRNASGELGNGTQADTSRPVAVSGGLTFTKVSAGSNNTCAISQGTVYCWGGNLNGQVGNGAAPDGPPVLVPTAVTMPAGVTFTALASGASFTCALANNGDVYCWGQNAAGKLGLGDTMPQGNFGSPNLPHETISVPTKVAGGHVFRALAAHSNNACGLSSSNEVFCWGDNLFHQLGSATTATCPNSISFWPCGKEPTQVGTGSGDGLAVGADFACNTNVYDLFCWGASAKKQLDNVAAAPALAVCNYPNGLASKCAPAPRKLKRAKADTTTLGYVAIAAGDDFLCSSVYPVGNSVICWGHNNHGQLGDSTTADRDTALALATPLGALDLSAGSSHACLVTDGANAYRVYCWGQNLSGQLGKGSKGADESTPQLVVEP